MATISSNNPTSVHYLGSVVCNILGDKAYLYLKGKQLEAHICPSKGEGKVLSSKHIKGGREGNLPLQKLIELVKTVIPSFLFASYQRNTLYLFPRDFREIPQNPFPKTRIHFPPNFFECIQRQGHLEDIQKALEEKKILVLLKNPKVPLKRVGKTEIAHQYVKEYGKNYTYSFWIQGFDPWFLQRDLEDIAQFLGRSVEEIPRFLDTDASYLLIFDGVEDPYLIEKYLPKNPKKGHILITSRSSSFLGLNSLSIGTLTEQEGIAFLLKTVQESQEAAQEVSKTLGYVPSSLYRALETITIEKLALSKYLTYCEGLLEKHAHMALKVTNLPLRNKDFVGREADLVALEESFSANKPVVLAANAGLGGIGKTQIALQYAYRAYPQYNQIWWINAAALDISFGILAEKLGIYLSEEEKKQEHAVIKKVNSYLERNPGWLLIFDNAEDEASVKGLLPESGGHVLITTRNPNWNQTQVEVFEIEVFKREESIELILKVTGLYGQEGEANQLAEKLQDLPLAIAQAAAYIKETKISIADYTKDFENWHKALWKRESPTNNYAFTVNVTWNISMKKIQEKEQESKNTPQPIALPLMQFCSFLASSDIPRDPLLLEWLKVEYEGKQFKKNTCLSDLRQTLELLKAFSMIKIEQHSISIHPMVQIVTRDGMEKLQASKVYEKVIDFLLENFMWDESTAKDLKNRMLLTSHVSAALRYESQYECDPIFVSYLKNCLGRFLFEIGNYHQAKHVAEEALKWGNQNQSVQKSGPGFFTTAGSTLSSALAMLGEFDKAIEESNKVIEKDLKREEGLLRLTELIVDYANLSDIYCKAGKYEEAKKVLEKGQFVQAFRSIVQNESKGIDTVAPLHIINFLWDRHRDIFQFLNRGSPTERLESQDYKCMANEYNRMLRGVAQWACNLAVTKMELSDFSEEVFQLLDKSLEFYKVVFKDEDHPRVIEVKQNLASYYDETGKFEEAKKIFNGILPKYEEIYGKIHPGIATCSIRFANVLRKLELFEEAKRFAKKAIDIDQKIFGKNHFTFARDHEMMGLIAFDQDAFKEAKKILEKVVKNDCRPYRIRGRALANLANVFLKSGDLEEGSKFLSEAISTIEKDPQQDIRILLEAYAVFINYNVWRGNKFNECREKVKFIESHVLELPDIESLKAYISISQYYSHEAMGSDKAKGQEYAYKALEVAKEFYPPNHANYIFAEDCLLTAQCSINPEKAEPVIKNLLSKITTLPNCHYKASLYYNKLTVIYTNLASLYRKQNHFDLAVKAAKNAKLSFDSSNRSKESQVYFYIMCNLAEVNINNQNYQEGIKIIDEIISKYQNKINQFPFIYTNCLRLKAKAIFKLHKDKNNKNKHLLKSKKLLEESEKIASQVFNPEHEFLKDIKDLKHTIELFIKGENENIVEIKLPRIYFP